MQRQPVNPTTALRSIARMFPDRPALIFVDQTVTYCQLLRLAESFALRLRTLGVGPTSTVHLDSRDAITVAPTLLATALLGARYLQNVGAIDQPGLPKVTHALAGPDAKPRDYPLVTINADWSPARVESEGLAWNAELDATDPDAPWLIVYTSGTTGTPKFLGLSHAMVAARSAAVADEFEPAKTRIASLFPTDSRPYMARLMAALWNGATVIAETDPAKWHELRVNRVSGSVGQAARHFAMTELSPRLPVIEVSGARLEDSVAELLLRSFDLVDDAYGASETNKTFSHFKTLSPDGMVLTTPHPRDSEILILQDDGQPAQAGEEGEVVIRNGYMAKGYMDAPEATAKAFRDSWFRPGDRGYFDVSGSLVILPRASGFTNVGGAKIGLTAIDGILRTVDGIRDAVVFPTPKDETGKKLIAFVVFEDNINRPQVAARARALCIDTLGEALSPSVIRHIDSVPRLADGQPDREVCIQLLIEALGRSTPAAASSEERH